MDEVLRKDFNSSITVYKGIPTEIFNKISSEYKINTVYTNNDY